MNFTTRICGRARQLAVATVALIIFSGALAYQSRAANVYSNNFTGGAGSEWSDPTTATSNSEAFLGSSAFGFGTGTDTLSLASLPGHTSVTVDFDLYIIESWDGNGPNGGGPDDWQLTADSANLLYTNFANYTNGNTQAYPDQLPPYGPGNTFAPLNGATDIGHLGYGNGDFGDATYHLSFTFPHSGPTLALAFTSFQNQSPGDEGWGLDNVSVSTSGVPEPSTIILGLIAASCFGAANCRHRHCKQNYSVA